MHAQIATKVLNVDLGGSMVKSAASSLPAEDATSLIARLLAQPRDPSATADSLRLVGDRLDPDRPESGTRADRETLRASVGAANGPAVVVQAMERHLGEVAVQVPGCRALDLLIRGNTPNQEIIREANGIPVLVAAMRAHVDVAAVQEAGCRALLQLAGNSDLNRSLIGSSAVGGVAAVVAAMRAHADVAVVQEAGCRALSNLTNQNAANRSLIGSSAVGGVPAVVAAMRAHADAAAVQDAGCRALFNIVIDNAANRSLVRSVGGLEAASAASSLFAQNKAIQGYSSWFMREIGHLTCGAYAFFSFCSLTKSVCLIVFQAYSVFTKAFLWRICVFSPNHL
jgi:hypothetical protein